VLALRAAALAAPPAEPVRGAVEVRLDGKRLGALDLAAPALPTIELPAGLASGTRTVELLGAPPGLRAELRLSYRPARAVASSAGLAVTVKTPAAAVAVGRRGAFAVEVANPGDATVAMPTVIVPVPPGFVAGDDAVDALKKLAGVARVEDLGSELRVYLRKLDPGETVTLRYGLEATAACRVTQRPAQAYAYYSPAIRGISAPGTVTAVR
jgi:hypothetical protein